MADALRTTTGTHRAAAAAVTITKFIGVASLGLLTGSSLTHALLTPPSLLALPKPNTATRAFSVLRNSAAKYHTALAATSLSSFLVAYVLSPRGWRHPYLLWTGLVVVVTGASVGGAGAEREYLAARLFGNSSNKEEEREKDMQVRLVDAEEGRMTTGEDAVNGEVVRGQLEDWGRELLLRSFGWGTAWAMATVGLWGDGFGIY